MSIYGLYQGNQLIDHGSLVYVAYELYRRKSVGDGDNLKIYRICIEVLEEISRDIYDVELDKYCLESQEID